jgi:hypothetical protein
MYLVHQTAQPAQEPALQEQLAIAQTDWDKSNAAWGQANLVNGRYISAQPAQEPERSEWKCYLFGNTPQDNQGIVWIPIKGQEPNRFVRWMMKVCFACTWVKEKNNG